MDDIKNNNINNVNRILDQEDIKSIIPHRDEFLLIERVEILDRGVEAIGYSNIKEDSWFFKGHFPEYKIMPGVLIVESMAQTAGVCALEPTNTEEIKPIFFVKIQNTTFRKPVLPETELYYHVKLQKKLRTFYTFECEAFFFKNGIKTITTTANIMATI